MLMGNNHTERVFCCGFAIFGYIMSAILALAFYDISWGADHKDAATGMEFIFVKGGCYQMGDTFGDGNTEEIPAHQVCVNDFYIGKHAVTQGQWKAVMGSNPSEFKECGDDCPVEQISWNDARSFIHKLNRMKPGNNYRLPTEAEWEYAARSGGKKEKYAGGADAESAAWYFENSDMKTHPVGTKAPNGLGLYDMSGNVFQWCLDWDDKNYYGGSPVDNPQGPASGEYRVIRGGSWVSTEHGVRTTYRLGRVPDRRSGDIGLRLLKGGN
jgi:formylglycine-generating enzyme